MPSPNPRRGEQRSAWALLVALLPLLSCTGVPASPCSSDQSCPTAFYCADGHRCAPLPAGASVVISPTQTAVTTGRALRFTATSIGGVDWSLMETSPKQSIDADGTFHAGSLPGTYHVVATSSAAPEKMAIAEVEVVAPPPIPVIVAPVIVTFGHAYSASVTADSCCSYSWSLSDGSIHGPPDGPTIRFVAGTNTGAQLTVTATNRAGDSSSAQLLLAGIPAPPACDPVVRSALRSGGQGTATVGHPLGSLTYRWTIAGGTLAGGGDSADGISTVFIAGPAGQMQLRCSSVNAAGDATDTTVSVTSVGPAVSGTIRFDTPAATADGTSAVRVTVSLADTNGAAAFAEPVSISATGSSNLFNPGTPAAAPTASGTTGADGTWTVSLASTHAETKRVGAQFQTSMTTSATVLFAAGSPTKANSRLLIDPSTTQVSAGGPGSVVAVDLADQFNNPVTNWNVLFQSSGTGNGFSPSSASATGSASVDLPGRAQALLSSTTAEGKTVTINVAAAGGGDPSTRPLFQLTGALAFTPGPPSSGTCPGFPGACSYILVGDPNGPAPTIDSPAPVTLMVRDAFANLVPGVEVHASTAQRFTLTPTTPGNLTQQDGAWRATLSTLTVAPSSIIATVGTSPTTINLSTTFQFLPGRPAGTSSLLASPSSLPGDGVATTRLTAVCRDQGGNPLGCAVRLSASTSSAAGSARYSLIPDQGNTTSTDGSFAATLAAQTVETKTITAVFLSPGPRGTGGATTVSTTVNFTSPAWNNIGPEGGSESSIVADSTHNLYVGGQPEGGGVFRYSAATQRWTRIEFGHSNACNLLAVAADDSLLCSGLSAAAIQRSTDRGETWHDVAQLNHPGPIARRGNDLFTTASGAASETIYQSTDNGATWNGIATIALVSGPPTATALLPDPNDPLRLYQIVQNRLCISADAGATFSCTPPPGVSDSSSDYRLAVDPSTSPSALWVVGRGAWLSIDRGASFRDVSSNGGGSLPTQDPPANCVVRVAASRVYVLNGVFLYSNSAAAPGAWRSSRLTDFHFGKDLIPDPSTPGGLLIATVNGSGVVRSTDGIAWTPFNAGLTGSTMTGIALSAHDPTLLYGNSYPDYESRDSGNSWPLINPALLVAPTSLDHAGNAYGRAGGGSTLRVGSTATAACANLPGGLRATQVQADPTGDGVAYATDAQGNVYRTADACLSWQQQSGQRLPVAATSSSSLLWASGVNLWVATSNGSSQALWSSSDMGSSFTQASYGSTVEALSVDASAPQHILIGSGVQVLQSVDRGQTWTVVTPAASGAPIGQVAIDPFLSTTLYAVTPAALFKSTDGGNSWRSVTSGVPPGAGLTALALDPVHAGTLYLATGSGLYKTTTGGE